MKETGGAVFSRDRKRRLSLWRRWCVGPTLLYVGVNPSSAGALGDEDQSTRKMRGFAERAGYGGYQLYNLFDWISTDPLALRKVPRGELLSQENFARIVSASTGCRAIACIWGRHGALHGAAAAFLAQIHRGGAWDKLRYLRVNADGSPAHVLMLPYELKFKKWRKPV